MSRTVRDVHSSQEKLRRYRAERLLRTGFAGMRSKVLVVVRSRLRAKGVALDRSDLEACYAQAWHALYVAVRAGEQIESPAAWLVLVTFRRAIDESRTAGRTRVGVAADVADGEQAGAAGRDSGVLRSQPSSPSPGAGTPWAGAVEPDVASQLDDRERLRHVFEAFRVALSPRECQAASLCYLQGLTRAEAARELGVSERRMGKLMEGGGGRPGVAGKVADLLATIGAGAWCEQQSSLVRAYALGLLDPAGERHELAVAHCRECPACRAHVLFLRGLAAVLPPLPLLIPSPRHAPRGWRWASGGRLLPKLAVCGVVAVGGSYALIGAGAHGGGLHARAEHVAAGAVAPGAPIGRRVAAGAKRAATARAHARPGTSTRRGSRTATPAPLSHTKASGEFLPERARAAPPPTAPASSEPPAREGGSAAAREFGIE